MDKKRQENIEFRIACAISSIIDKEKITCKDAIEIIEMAFLRSLFTAAIVGTDGTEAKDITLSVLQNAMEITKNLPDDLGTMLYNKHIQNNG